MSSSPGGAPARTGGTPLQDHAPEGRPMVTLSDQDVKRAREHAQAVALTALTAGLSHKFNTPGEDPLDWQTRGYAAEIAVAKWLGVEWTPWLWTPEVRRKPKRADVAGIEVRNARQPRGYLWVYGSDPNGTPVLLVTGKVPTFEIVGWLYSQEVRRMGLRTTTASGMDAWCIEQDFLRPPSSVPVQP